MDYSFVKFCNIREKLLICISRYEKHRIFGKETVCDFEKYNIKLFGFISFLSKNIIYCRYFEIIQ